MCGIFGWDITGKVTKNQRKLLAHGLAKSNDLRGGHSWGYCDVNNMRVERGLGNMSPEWAAFYRADRLLAHTRFATTGEITVGNAHPFRIGGIVGAHNGMIFNHKMVNLKYNRNYSVDSQHIFRHLAEGIDLRDLEGYGAIEWLKKKDPGSIYLCRLSFAGDLAMARIKVDGRCAGSVWSSDGKHLNAVLGRTGLEFVELKVDTNKVYFVRDGESFISTGDELKLAGGWSYRNSAANGGFYSSRSVAAFNPTDPWDDENESWERYRSLYLPKDEGGESQLSAEDRRDVLEIMGNEAACGSIKCCECYFEGSCLKEFGFEN